MIDNKTLSQQYSEALVETAFSKLGYFTYTNRSGKASSDLIVEDSEANLYKVEVKSSSTVKKNSQNEEFIEVQLKSIRSNRSTNTIHKFDNTSCDVLAIVEVTSGLIKFLNSIEMTNTSTLRVYLKDMFSLQNIQWP